MKITDVRLTLFAWDEIPATTYGRHTGRFSGSSQLGLVTIATDEGVEGHAFLGSAMRGAHMDAQSLVHYLKPLVLKQVAEDIGMHESTISRVTANKYMYCPQGMLELKFFFNAGLQRADLPSDMLSSVTVREMIKKMVAEEDANHPLKDEEIAARLRERQVLIARRTVAKYRAEENIPPATQRKRFF